MFTGIVQTVGEIVHHEADSHGCRITFSASALSVSDLNIGESIATNGVCLTVASINKEHNTYITDLSVETLKVSTAKYWQKNDLVNLERSLTLQQLVGGHLVSGHVDTTVIVLRLYAEANSTKITISAPQEMMKYIIHKGSICIDGTSLTVNSVADEQFDVCIVPHTMEHTIMKNYQEGTEVNLEIDLIARYLESLINSKT